MIRRAIPIINGCYADDTRSWSDQDTVNWLPVAAEQEGGRSATMLRTPPGLQEFATMGSGHRGARNVEGALFVVSGTTLYQVATAGTVTSRGTIPGTARVSMTHNQIAGGNQLVIGTGASGYVYNTVTQSLTQITDDGFPGFLICDYINSLIIGIEPARRYFFNSALADALTYSALETYESEASPDRLRSLIVDHLEVWLLNERTIEIFENTGVINSLFQNKRIVIEQGCASTHAVSKLDNSVFWLGSDGSAYRANGYTPQRISTGALEAAWKMCDLSKAFSFTWADRGHKVWYLTFPDGRTWGYDCLSQNWHRRQSQDMDRWRLATMVEWNGAWYGGAFNSGILYRLSWNYFQEGASVMASERTTGVLSDNQNRVTVSELELVFGTLGRFGSGQFGGEEVNEPETQTTPVTTGGGPFIATARSVGTAQKSADGITWVDQTGGLSGVSLRYNAASPSTVVSSNGSGQFYYSADRGVNWTASATAPVAGAAYWITYHNNRFVALVWGGAATTVSTLVSTDDGRTWQTGGVISAAPANCTPTGLVGGNNVFVFASQSAGGGVWSSPDGITWTNRSSVQMGGVGFNGVGFLATTTTAYYSTNGISWTSMGGAGLPTLGYAITGGAGYFVVGTFGGSGIYRTTDNGTTWTSVQASVASLYSAASNGSTLVIGAGGGGSDLQYVSTNSGVTWTLIAPALNDTGITCMPAP